MTPKSDGKGAEFVFLPLGGVGEIGMNLYLYGYGRAGARQWLIVDMGVTFGTEYEPGVDLILPDIRFIEEERHNIAARWIPPCSPVHGRMWITSSCRREYRPARTFIANSPNFTM